MIRYNSTRCHEVVDVPKINYRSWEILLKNPGVRFRLPSKLTTLFPGLHA